jgi:hypothetical protein
MAMVAIGVSLAAGLGVVWMASAQSVDATFRPVGWGSEATLQLRGDGAGGLLFAPGIRYIEPPQGAARHEAYRYDLALPELTPATSEAWSRAPGAIVDCDRAGLSPASRVDAETGGLRLDGRAVSMSGRVRHVRVSPDERFVAVVTASGIPTPSASPVPALGGRAILGWRFHHVLSKSSREQIGPPAALGFGVSDPMPCWSPDGRIVIYANPAFTTVAIVRVPE